MEVTIKGSPKEIAALALELQERQGNGISLQKAREIARKIQKYDNHKASFSPPFPAIVTRGQEEMNRA